MTLVQLLHCLRDLLEPSLSLRAHGKRRLCDKVVCSYVGGRLRVAVTKMLLLLLLLLGLLEELLELLLEADETRRERDVRRLNLLLDLLLKLLLMEQLDLLNLVLCDARDLFRVISASSRRSNDSRTCMAWSSCSCCCCCNDCA